MKKIFMAAAALCCAMTLTVLTACTNDNDDNPTPNPSKGDGFVHITMQLADYGDFDELAGDSIDNSDNASAATVRAATRAIVSTETGGVKFVNGDVVLVANAGRYIGSMTYRDGLLEGDIFEPSTEDYLHLYFLGNKQPADLIPGETTSCAVDISDQSKQLPILCYGASHIKYAGPNVNYMCFMMCRGGLVEIDLLHATGTPILLSDMQVKANIDFANPDNAITTADSTGSITMYAADATMRLAVVLKQPAMDTVAVCEDIKRDYVSLPEIQDNYAFVGAKAIKADPSYYFSVGQGHTVAFSKGLLQCRRLGEANYEWRLSDSQFEQAPYDPMSGNWFDKFMFKMWGGPGACNDPLQETLYYWGGSENYAGELDGHSNWRTLTRDQWEYLLGHSPEREGMWCISLIHDKPCLAIFPDNYHGHPYTPGAHRNDQNIIWFNANLTNFEWDDMMNDGVIIMPAHDEYWTRDGEGQQAAPVCFSIYEMSWLFSEMVRRNDLYRVRLVRYVK